MTMTVKELKEMLAIVDNNAEVTITSEGGYLALEAYKAGEFTTLLEVKQ